MSNVTILAVLALLAALYLKVKSWLLERETTKLTKEVQDAKENANQKVGAAASAESDFEQRLRDYRNKTPNSTSGSSSDDRK